MKFVKKFMADLLPNLLQLGLFVVLLPFACLVMYWIGGFSEAINWVLNLIGVVDFFDPIMNFVSVGMQSQAPSLTENFEAFAYHLAQMISGVDNTLFELLLIAICVKLFVLIFDLCRIPGLRLLPGLAGVFLGCIVMKLYEVPMMAAGFLLTLVMVLDMIFLRKPGFNIFAFLAEYLKFCLEMTLKILGVAFMAGFIAVLAMIWLGGIPNIGMTIFMLLMFAVPWFLTSAANRYLLTE